MSTPRLHYRQDLPPPFLLSELQDSLILWENKTDFDITDSDPKLLFEHEDCSTTQHQDKLLSTVLEKLKENDTANDFQTFLDLVSHDRFPLDNIAFLLFLDTVRFFGCENPSTMRYRSVTKSFWNTGRNLFHNKFLYFMGGPRSIGQDEIPYDSQFSRINFAVPDTKSLNEYKRSSFDIPKRMETGCLPNVLDNINAQPEDSFMLCADAKKVTSGLDNSGGDVDMFGFETGESLASRKERLHKETDELNIVKKLTEEEVSDKVELSRKLKDVILLLSNRMKECRELKFRQEYGLQKFMSLGGSDWRNSKYIYAISSLQASIFQLKQQIDNTHREVFLLCRATSSLQSPVNDFDEDDVVVLTNKRNTIRLADSSEDTSPQETRFIKQRSPMWHAMRKSARVTGSTVHSAIGLRGLKAQKLHFEEYIEGKPMQISAELEKRFTHGSENEQHAIATLIGTILPVYYPSACYVEEGCYLVQSHTSEKTILEVSPDGSIRDVVYSIETGEPTLMGDPLAAIEIKCPYPGNGEARPHYSLPEYYVAQCLAEMHVLHTNNLLFLSYTARRTTAFLVTFDDDLWKSLWNEICLLYDKDDIPKFKKLSECIPSLKSRLSEFTARNVLYMGEFESKRLGQEDSPMRATNMPLLYALQAKEKRSKVTMKDIRDGLDRTSTLVRDMYNLLRQKATEVMVWVLTNKDRNSKQEIPCSIPIAFGLKDYKLTASAMRQATEFVLEECQKRRIRIDSLSADGQWILLMNRDEFGRPSTIYQLQKDVWQSVRKMSKAEIVRKLLSINVVDTSKIFDNDEVISVKKDFTNGSIVVTSHTKAFDTVRSTTKRQSWLGHTKASQNSINQEKESPETTLTEESQLLSGIDWLPSEIIQEISNGNEELFQAVRIVEMTRSAIRDSNICSLSNNDTIVNAHEGSGNADETSEGVDTSTQVEEPTNRRLLTNSAFIGRVRHSLQNVKRIWESKDECLIREALLKPDSLSHAEINAVYDCLLSENESVPQMRKSWNKPKKVFVLNTIFGNTQTDPVCVQKKRLRTALSLKILATKEIRSRRIPKEVVAVAYAQYIFPKERDTWIEQSCVPKDMKIEGFDSEIPYWFSLPEVSTQTGSLLTKGIDCSHNLTHMRVRTSTTGICGVSPHAWKECAKSKETDLHPAIVDDLLDKQSVSFARTHFSENVEKWMDEHGFHQAAILTRMIRRWYEACDAPSVSAHNRISDLLTFRNFLLKDINFGEFPPITRYFKGIPVVTFEGMIMDIDSKLQLFGISGAYNIRSVGSLAAETAVGVLQTLNQSSQVSIKAVDVPKLMSTVVEVMTCKLNPNR